MRHLPYEDYLSINDIYDSLDKDDIDLIPLFVKDIEMSRPMNEQIHMPVGTIKEMMFSEFRIKMLNENISVVSKMVNVEANRDDFKQFILTLSGIVTEDLHSRMKNSVFRSHASDVLIEYTPDDKMMEVVLVGIESSVQSYLTRITDKFPKPTSYIRWIFDPQSMMSQTIPVDKKNKPFSEMYPFLKDESLGDYYDRFMASDAGILLLTGPPGTGKTSFIRGLLNHCSENCVLTYNPALLQQDGFFAEWLGDDEENVLVIEDSDLMIGSRKEGNTLMHRFLNLGDGLITIPGKKMIFSTNLTSLDQIDSALTRPGRCHDILEFRHLTTPEAQVVAKKGGTTLSIEQDKWTIAEIFSNLKTRKEVAPKAAFGFMTGR